MHLSTTMTSLHRPSADLPLVIPAHQDAPENVKPLHIFLSSQAAHNFTESAEMDGRGCFRDTEYQDPDQVREKTSVGVDTHDFALTDMSCLNQLEDETRAAETVPFKGSSHRNGGHPPASDPLKRTVLPIKMRGVDQINLETRDRSMQTESPNQLEDETRAAETVPFKGSSHRNGGHPPGPASDPLKMTVLPIKMRGVDGMNLETRDRSMQTESLACEQSTQTRKGFAQDIGKSDQFAQTDDSEEVIEIEESIVVVDDSLIMMKTCDSSMGDESVWILETPASEHQTQEAREGISNSSEQHVHMDQVIKGKDHTGRHPSDVAPVRKLHSSKDESDGFVSFQSSASSQSSTDSEGSVSVSIRTASGPDSDADTFVSLASPAAKKSRQSTPQRSLFTIPNPTYLAKKVLDEQSVFSPCSVDPEDFFHATLASLASQAAEKSKQNTLQRSLSTFPTLTSTAKNVLDKQSVCSPSSVYPEDSFIAMSSNQFSSTPNHIHAVSYRSNSSRSVSDTTSSRSVSTSDQSSFSPACNFVGPTYWESCLSDRETQGKRYFDMAESSDDDVSADSETLSLYKPHQKKTRSPGTQQIESLFSKQARKSLSQKEKGSIPELKVLCKSFLGLDVSDSLPSIHLDTEDDISEVSPRETDCSKYCSTTDDRLQGLQTFMEHDCLMECKMTDDSLARILPEMEMVRSDVNPADAKGLQYEDLALPEQVSQEETDDTSVIDESEILDSEQASQRETYDTSSIDESEILDSEQVSQQETDDTSFTNESELLGSEQASQREADDTSSIDESELLGSKQVSQQETDDTSSIDESDLLGSEQVSQRETDDTSFIDESELLDSEQASQRKTDDTSFIDESELLGSEQASQRETDDTSSIDESELLGSEQASQREADDTSFTDESEILGLKQVSQREADDTSSIDESELLGSEQVSQREADDTSFTNESELLGSEQVSQRETDDTSFTNESELLGLKQVSQQEADDTSSIDESEILDLDQHAQKEGVLVDDIGTKTAGKSPVSGQHFGESGNKLARGCQTYSAEPTYKATGTDVVRVDNFVDGAFQQAKLKVEMQGSDSCKTKSSGSSSFDPLPDDFETFCIDDVEGQEIILDSKEDCTFQLRPISNESATNEVEGQENILDSKEDCTFQLRPISNESATDAAKAIILVAQSPAISSAGMNRKLDESGQSLHPPDYKLPFDRLDGIPDSPLTTHPMQPGATEHDASLFFEMEHFSPEPASRFSPPIPGPVSGKMEHFSPEPASRFSPPIPGPVSGKMEHFSPEPARRFSPPIPGPVSGKMEHFSPEPARRFSPPIPGPVSGKRDKKIKRVSFSDVMSGPTVLSPVSPGLTENFDGHTDDAPSGQITSPDAVKKIKATGGEEHWKDKGRSRGEDRQGHCEGEKGETATGGNKNFEGHSDEERSGQIPSPGVVKKRGATGGEGHGKDKGRSRGEDRKGLGEGERGGRGGTGGDEKENKDRGEGEQGGTDKTEDGDDGKRGGNGRGLDGGEGKDDPADDIDVTSVRSYVVHVIRMAQLQYKSLSETSKKQPFAESGDDAEVELEDTVFEHTPEDKETDSQNALGSIGLGPDRKLSDPASDKLGELDPRNQSQDPKPIAKHGDTEAGEQNSHVTPREQSENQGLDGTATEHKYDRHNISDDFETPEKVRFSHNLEMSFSNLSMSSLDSSVLKGSGRQKDYASEDSFLTFEQLQLPPLLEGGEIPGHSPLAQMSAELEACPVAAPEMEPEQESTLPMFNLELMTVSPPSMTFHTLETLSSCSDKELLREPQRQGQAEARTSDNAASSKAQKDESGTAQPPVTMKPSCGEGASLLPPPIDVNASTSLMRTPVRNSGHDIPLEMPKTPVPSVRYRHSMVETSALSGFGTRPSFLKSYSTTDANPKTGRSRPPLLTARSVTSLYSPLKAMTSDRVKSSPLFEAPRRKSTTALQGASAVRRLDLTSDDPGEIQQTHRPMYAKGMDVGSKRKGGVLESTVIPPQEVVFTRFPNLPQAFQEVEQSHHSLRNSLSAKQTSVSDIAEEEKDGFDLKEDDHDSFTRFKAKYGLLSRASKGVSDHVAKRTASKTLDFSIEPKAEVDSTTSEEIRHFARSFLPERTVEEMNAEEGEHEKCGKHCEETIEQETHVRKGNDKYDKMIGSLKETQQDFKEKKQDFKEIKKDFEDTQQDFQETKQDFQETKQDFQETKQDFQETKQDFQETNQDFKEIKKDFEDTQQDFQETKQDFQETKQDFQETKQDFQETKQDFQDTKQDFQDTKQDFQETKQDFQETKQDFQEKKQDFQDTKQDFQETKQDFQETKQDFQDTKQDFQDTKQDFQDTKQDFKETQQDFKETQQDFQETKQDFQETQQDFKDTQQDFKETQQDFKETKQNSKETKQDLKETKQDFEETKQNSKETQQDFQDTQQDFKETKQDLKETKRSFFKKSSTSSFIFNAAEHLNKLIKSKLTSSKQNTTPMTPVALPNIPPPPNNTPCTPRTPSETTSTPLTPSDSPRTPRASSETSTPLTPSKQNTTPKTPVALPNIPSTPNNTPCTPRTPSKTTITPSTHSDSPNTPGHSHSCPQASDYSRSIYLTPSSRSSISFTSRTPYSTPLSPSEKSAASAQPAIENAGLIKDDKSSMQTEKSSQDCMSPNILRSVLTVDELRCSSEEAPGKVSTGERRIRQAYATRLDKEQCMSEDPKRTTLKEFIARETSERRRKFGMLVASFEGASAVSSPPLSPRVIPPWKRNQEKSETDGESITSGIKRGASKETRRRPEGVSAGSSRPLSPRVIPPWKRSQEKSETDGESITTGIKRGASKETRRRPATSSTPKPKHDAIEESSITACQLEEPSPTTEKCKTLCPDWKPWKQKVVGDSSVAFIKQGASTRRSPTAEKSSTLCPEWKPLKRVVGDSSVAFINGASTRPSPTTEKSSTLCPEWKPLKRVVGDSSFAFITDGASTRPSPTTEKSSTLCPEWKPLKRVVGDSSFAFITDGASTRPSPTTEKSSTLCPEWKPLKRVVGDSSVAFINGASTAPSPTTEKPSTLCPDWKPLKRVVGDSSVAIINGASTRPSPTTEKSSTPCPDWKPLKRVVGDSSVAIINGASTRPSPTTEKPSSLCPDWKPLKRVVGDSSFAFITDGASTRPSPTTEQSSTLCPEWKPWKQKVVGDSSVAFINGASTQPSPTPEKPSTVCPDWKPLKRVVGDSSVAFITDGASTRPSPTTENYSSLCPEWKPLKRGSGSEMKQSLKPPRKVSVVKKSSRKLTPYSPGAQDLLSSAAMQSVVLPLASLKGKSATARPLYIVHPITGMVEILKELASGLDIRCFGINKTDHAVDFSIETLARFYCQAITQQNSTGTYRLAGYSYGGMVVFEMARQMQREGKQVELLLMLDGSPDYVKCQTQFPRRHLAPDASPEHVTAAVETHFLLYIMNMYEHVEQRELVKTMLEEQETQEQRVEAAIGVTMGTVKVSASAARGRWLGLMSKVDQAKKDGGHKVKVTVSHVADDVISLKRQQKAMQLLRAANIADKYDASEGEMFQGNIHLVRIKTTPEYSTQLAADYGLSRLCTGTVRIHHVDGGHESMMTSPHVQSVISAVKGILRDSN